VTMVALHDVATVLERRALYENKKARSGIFSKNGIAMITRQWLEASRWIVCKGEMKLCLTGSGLEEGLGG
jgi:hypothetical protein